MFQKVLCSLFVLGLLGPQYSFAQTPQPTLNENALKIKVITFGDTVSSHSTLDDQLIALTQALSTIRSDVLFDVGLWARKKETDKTFRPIVKSFFTNIKKYCENKDSDAQLFMTAKASDIEIHEKDFYKGARSFGFKKEHFLSCIQWVDPDFGPHPREKTIFITNIEALLRDIKMSGNPAKPVALAVLRKSWDDIQEITEVTPPFHDYEVEREEDDPEKIFGFRINFGIDPFENYHAPGQLDTVGKNAISVSEYLKNPIKLDADLVIFAVQNKKMDWHNIPASDISEAPGYFILISSIRTVESFINR